MADFASAKLPPFSLLQEPLLAFAPENDKATDVHPLRGLANHGPYTKSVFKSYTPAVRVATVGPQSGWQQRGDLMRMLKTTHRPSDRKEYVPPFPGFQPLFGAELAAAVAAAHIKWPDDLTHADTIEQLQASLVVLLNESMQRLSLVRHQFDVVLVHFPDPWSFFLRTPGFDAHDILKGISARLAIPTQVINDRVFSFRFRASLAWRLAIALYVKAGGIPWKLAPLDGVPYDSAYIGLAYALRGDPQHAHYVTCCSQVFDMDGGGMHFVAFEARDPIKNFGSS